MTINDLRKAVAAAKRAKTRLLDIAEGGEIFGSAPVMARDGIEHISETLWILEKEVADWERANQQISNLGHYHDSPGREKIPSQVSWQEKG